MRMTYRILQKHSPVDRPYRSALLWGERGRRVDTWRNRSSLLSSTPCRETCRRMMSIRSELAGFIRLEAALNSPLPFLLSVSVNSVVFLSNLSPFFLPFFLFAVSSCRFHWNERSCTQTSTLDGV